MTNEEAISTIHCAIGSGCSQICNAKYRGDCTDADVIDASKMAIKALEKADKYRWHDLRKNPNDLPSVDGDYMCRVCARKYPERPMTYEPYDLRVDGENKWRDFEGYVYDHFIIAWREIEPFEEVSE